MPENNRHENYQEARLKEITQGLERGIRELFASDHYADYLRTMSRFTRYSVNNTILIHMQKPDATHVAGFGKWRDQFGRHVKRGEKAIRIFAPVPYTRVIEREKLDPDTQAPIIGPDGQVEMEKVKITSARFRAIPVFDVSQTEGRPLPDLVKPLLGDVDQFEIFMEALRRSSPVPMEVLPLPDDTDGQYIISEKRIQLREGMSEKSTISAAIHEIAHAKLHDPNAPADPLDVRGYSTVMLFDKPMLFTNNRVSRNDLPEGLYCYDLRGTDNDPGRPVALEASATVNHAGSIIAAEPIELPEAGYISLGEGLDFLGGADISLREYFHLVNPDNPLAKSRSTKEVEAESVSYTICQYYGIETKENSFGYIAHWSKDKELSQLKASLQLISKAANDLITDIDRHFAEICQERGIVQEQNVSQEKQETASAEQNASVDSSTDLVKQKISSASETTLFPDSFALPRADFSPDSSVDKHAFEGMPELTGLLPVGKEKAFDFYEKDMSVYIVQPSGNNAEMAIVREDIENHDKLFAVPRTEWEQSPEYRERVETRDLAEKKLEETFKSYPSDAFTIYQLKEMPENRDRRFEPLSFLRMKDLNVERQLYEPLYTATIPKGNDPSFGDPLNQLYLIFNSQQPIDFDGHSLSISDVVALKQNGVVTYHYVDNLGFPDVSREFDNNPLKNAEIAVEDDYGMIDGLINNGKRDDSYEKKLPEKQATDKKQFLPDKRPSVIERLKALSRQTPPSPTAPKRAEMER